MVDILHRIGIKGSIDAVFRALSTAEGVAAWWTTDTQGSSDLGKTLKVRFTHEGRELGFFDLKVVALDPSKHVLWQVTDGPPEWIGTKIAFDLKQEDDYAIVLFKHEGWTEPSEFMSHCSSKWASFLMSLKALVETGQGAPNPHDVQISNWH